MKQTFRLSCAVLALVGALPAAAPHAFAEEEAAATKMPVITLDGAYREAGVAFSLFGDEPQFFRDLLATIRKAAGDDDVGALALKMDSPGLGIAQAAALHRELMAFRGTGKPIVSVSDSYSLGKYLLASPSDEIVLMPISAVEIYGLSFDMYYFKDMLGKLGIGTQVVNTGQFKNAMESFTHDAMTEGTRIQMGAILDDIAGWMAERVAEGRGVEVEEAAGMLWSGPYTAQQALDLGMVTTLAYQDDFLREYSEERGLELDWDYTARPQREREPFNIFNLFNPQRRDARRAAAGERIAVVYALGPIMDGRADSGPFSSGQTIASEDFLELLDRVEEDGDVKALVLRVDSPGGSAIASDRIWNRVQSFVDADIPVVVSMGNVAASGGYYISMNADRIYAEPTTITGSIGVIGGRIVLGGVYDKIGVSKDHLRIGKFSGLMDESKEWNAEEAALIEGFLEDIYDVFTSKAADGRGMSQDEIKAIAEGRVWTGLSAVRNGLVDDLGGLDDAIAAARELGGLDDDIRVVFYPREKTIEEMIQELLGGGRGSASVQALGLAARIELPAAFLAMERALPAGVRDSFWSTLSLLDNEEPKALLMAPGNFEIRF